MEKRSGSPSQSITFPQTKQRSENPQYPQSRKVGVFCFSQEPKEPKEEDIKVYVLDLGLDGSRDGGDEFKEIEPAYHLRLPLDYQTQAICVKGSTLYLFEGENTFGMYRNPNRKTVRKLVLSPEVLAGGKVVKGVEGDVKKLGDMNYIKYEPKALLTPDAQQILVFSTQFFGQHYDYMRMDGPSPRAAFELYDIGENCWDTLPEIPISPLPRSAIVIVTTFAFIDHSRLLLCTNKGGSFLLNFKSKEWTKLAVGDTFQYFEDNFIILSGRVALFPRALFQSKDGKMVFEYRNCPSEAIEIFHFPLSELPPNNHSLLKKYHWYCLFRASLVPLQPDVFSIQEDDWFVTYTLQSQYFAHAPDGTREIRLLIDLRCIHLTSHDAQVLNTVKARIGHKGLIAVLALFPLP